MYFPKKPFFRTTLVLRPRKEGPPVRGFVMRRPGALHHTQFMHHGLYLLKMALLADTITCMTTEESGRVERMAKLIALFHGPLFLQASLAAGAPRLDIQLCKHMDPDRPSATGDPLARTTCLPASIAAVRRPEPGVFRRPPLLAALRPPGLQGPLAAAPPQRVAGG